MDLTTRSEFFFVDTSYLLFHSNAWLCRKNVSKCMFPLTLYSEVELENTKYCFGLLGIYLPSSLYRVMISVSNILRLSELFDLDTSKPGVLLVEFVFKMVSQLLDAALSDEGLLELSQDSSSQWLVKSQDMEIDAPERYNEKTGSLEKLQSLNTIMAIELIAEFLRNTVIARLLYLVSSNRYAS